MYNTISTSMLPGVPHKYNTSTYREYMRTKLLNKSLTLQKVMRIV